MQRNSTAKKTNNKIEEIQTLIEQNPKEAGQQFKKALADYNTELVKIFVSTPNFVVTMEHLRTADDFYEKVAFKIEKSLFLPLGKENFELVAQAYKRCLKTDPKIIPQLSLFKPNLNKRPDYSKRIEIQPKRVTFKLS